MYNIHWHILLFSNGTTGLTSWPAGIHLCQYLEQNSQLIKGKKVVELGRSGFDHNYHKLKISFTFLYTSEKV